MSYQPPEERPVQSWPPQDEWLTVYHQRTPYNEDEIVALVTEIFNFLLLFGYMSPSEVEWAPPPSAASTGHLIDLQLCHELGIDDGVVQLMRKLPYVREGGDGDDNGCFNLFPRSRYWRYTNEWDLRTARFAGGAGAEDEERDLESQRLKAWEISLADGETDGTGLILDTRENVIRVINPQGRPKGEELRLPLENPNDEGHYRNLWGRHAPSFLRRHIEMIRTLSRIPICTHGVGDLDNFCDETFAPNLNAKMKKKLTEQFGYPDNFQREQWVANHEEIWDGAMMELEEEGLEGP